MSAVCPLSHPRIYKKQAINNYFYVLFSLKQWISTLCFAIVVDIHYTNCIFFNETNGIFQYLIMHLSSCMNLNGICYVHTSVGHLFVYIYIYPFKNNEPLKNWEGQFFQYFWEFFISIVPTYFLCTLIYSKTGFWIN